jgi:ion channel-forming bestrophin family protein
VIVKRNLNPLKVLGYVWQPLLYATGVAGVVVVAQQAWGTARLAAPVAPIGTLGAALAIFVALRNNPSYARWWEARTVWGNLQGSSRVLARQLVAVTDNAIAAGTGGGRDEVLAYRRELVLRVAAFAHALRVQLRGTEEWDRLRPLLPAAEFDALAGLTNRPNAILQALSIRLKDGVRAGIVGQFDPITLEPNVVALNAAAASCERIKSTPTPRQYDFFTRAAVVVFATLLPFGLASVVPADQWWWLVVLSVALSGVFIVLERAGAVIDTPFENRVTDVALTAITTDIERDLRQQLHDPVLPAPEPVVGGYLW